jgi:hypothetical protein
MERLFQNLNCWLVKAYHPEPISCTISISTLFQVSKRAIKDTDFERLFELTICDVI